MNLNYSGIHILSEVFISFSGDIEKNIYLKTSYHINLHFRKLILIENVKLQFFNKIKVN